MAEGQLAVDIVGAVIGGAVSGLVGGLLGARFYVTRSARSAAGQNAQSISGRGSQGVASGGHGAAASTRRGSITQTFSSTTPPLPAALAATVVAERRGTVSTQYLVVRNTGGMPANNISLAGLADGGEFISQPRWQSAPTTLQPGEEMRLDCVTTGRGFARFNAQYQSGTGERLAQMVEAAHL